MVKITVYGADGRPYPHEIPGAPAAPPATTIRMVNGLDLGQRQDYSAFCGIEQHRVGAEPATYKMRRLKRWRDVAYTAIVAELAARFMAWGLGRRDALVVDETGVGIAVVDQIRAARLPTGYTPVTITAGVEATRAGIGWHVPKRDLISTVAVLLEQRRLEVAADLPETPTLTEELAGFQTRVTAAGHDRYGTWREGAHDDLVLAVALAVWYGEHVPIPRPSRPVAGGTRPLVAAAGRLYRRDAGIPARPRLEPPPRVP